MLCMCENKKLPFILSKISRIHICRNYYYYINIYHGQCMNAHVLLCSMVYQPHSFPPSISSFIIEIAFAIIWATGTRLAFAMFRSGTTSVRTSEIGKYPDGILPQHGLWTMDYGLWTYIYMGWNIDIQRCYALRNRQENMHWMCSITHCNFCCNRFGQIWI